MGGRAVVGHRQGHPVLPGLREGVPDVGPLGCDAVPQVPGPALHRSPGEQGAGAVAGEGEGGRAGPLPGGHVDLGL